MKNIILFFSILAVYLLCPYYVVAQGQAPNVMWQKIYNCHPWTYINTMIQTPDSGFIMACSTMVDNGTYADGHGDIDIWIVKVDANGWIQWSKAYGGSKKDQVVRISAGLNGGYIFTGLTYSTDGDIPTGKNHGKCDAWVVKIDDSGNIEWQQVLGGSGIDFGNDIIATPDNGYLMVGATYSKNGNIAHNAGTADVWLVKMDAKGKVLWCKTYGGSKIDIGSGVINTSAGDGYLVSCGSFSNDGQVTNNHGGKDFWLLKVDTDGKLIWQKSYGGSKNDFARSIVPTYDHGYMACGMSSSTDGDVTSNKGGQDFWVLKINVTGDLQWQQTYGGTGNEQALTIKQTKDSNFVVSGITTSTNGDVEGNHGGIDCWIIKINETGSMIWQKTIGGKGQDSCNYIIPTIDGGYAIAGSTSTQKWLCCPEPCHTAGWLVKLEPEGSICTTIQPYDLTNDKIKIYPTITKNNLNIVLPEYLENAKIIITDLQGSKKEYIGDHTGINRKLLLNNYIPGTYLLRIADIEDGYKFVVIQ